MLLSEKIKKHRKEKKLTLEQLGNIVGTKKEYIWQLEKNLIKQPSGRLVQKLALALNVDSDYLLDEKRKEFKSNSFEKSFIKKFHSLDKKKQRQLSKMLDIIAKE